ncbi:hypothetical protein [Variovorax sp. dw_308]|uniref:hypothetical protein n=1 Tax=Variovorax sp. dw_308 TaxID=2721546 RepID=UPI001C43B670|nr:hypothetical protein [Variovorax sp. dw_308]
MRKKSSETNEPTATVRVASRPRRKSATPEPNAPEENDPEALIARVEAVREASRLIARELLREETARFVEGQYRLLMRLFAVASKLERKSQQAMADLLEPRRMSALRVKLEARAIQAVMTGTEWLTDAEIGQLVYPKVFNARATVKRWLANGRIFGIDHRGKKLYPLYAFDATWQPLPAVKEILSVLGGLEPFMLACWFDSASLMLSGKRPREVIASNPDAVLAAAKDYRSGAIDG